MKTTFGQKLLASPFVGALVGTLVLGTLIVVPGASAPAESSPTLDAPQEVPEPGKEHKMIASRAGTWNVVAKMKLMPGMDWMSFDGKDIVTTGAGGFWIFSTFTCEFMGMPFEGRQTMGYDQRKKKYVSTWVSSMGSAMESSEGTYDAEKKVLNFTGKSFDPTSNKEIISRTEVQFMGGDKSVMKGFRPDADGKEFQNMEFVYTRAKKKGN
ncbi:MAG: hypothetical protein CMJ83_13725 [Planctomycetes bacterium]|nr:hypothetical protein [Planctomycetota bacterium]